MKTIASRMREPVMIATLALIAIPVVGQDLTNLGDDELRKRAASEIQAVAVADAAIEADRKALAAGDEELDRERAAFAEPLPDRPTVPAVGELPPTAVPDLVGRWEEFSKALQERLRLGERLAGLLDARARLITGARTKAEGLVAAAAGARPTLVETARRVDAGRIRADDVTLDSENRSAAAWIDRIDFLTRGAGTLRTTLAGQLTKVETERTSLASAREEARAAEQGGRLAQETVRLLALALAQESNELEELRKLDAATLPVALGRLVEDRRREEESYDKSERATAVTRAQLQAADVALATAVAPTRESVPAVAGHPELQEASRNAAFSELLVAHRERVLELRRQAHAATEVLRGMLSEAGESFESVHRLTVRLRAAILLANELRAAGEIADVALPEGNELTLLWRRTHVLADREAQRRLEVAVLQERLSSTQAIQDAEQEIEKERTESRRLQAILGEEQSYASYLTEMADKSEDELLDLCAATGDLELRLADRSQTASKAAKAGDAAEQKVRSIRDAIRTLENPYTQIGIRLAGARVQEIRKELEALKDAKDGRWPTDMGSRPLGIPATSTAQDAPATDVTSSEPERAEKEALEREQAFAKEVLQYFVRLNKDLDRWRVALAEKDAAQQVLAGALSDLVNEEKRKYAAAREIERRDALGRVPRERLPVDLRKWVSRDAIAAAQKRREDVSRRGEEARTRRQQDLKRLESLVDLHQWADRRSNLTDRRATLAGRPLAHLVAARSAFESLPDVQQHTLRYRAEVRRRDEDAPFDRLLAGLTEARTRERFDRPLDAYYIELVANERSIQEFKAATAEYAEIIDLTSRQLEELAPCPSALREVIPLRREQYDATRALAAIAACPERQSQIEAAWRTEFKKELPVPADTKDWSLLYWADQLFAAEARLWGHLRWIDDTDRMLSKLGLDADIARTRAIQARISAESEVGDANAHQLGEEIAALRHEFARYMREDALWSLGQVMVIPVLAWFVVRLLRRFARRIEAGAQQSGTDQEHQRRLSTLARVLSAAISGTVWVITGIYVIGRLGIDITPILASAGVVGLAVAFGAQTMIKDFLSGFFILLENQFRIGDVITLDAIGGVVERISLRVTVLRDLEGTVHYVPNGIVGRVSNLTQGWSRVVLEVGVGYRENIDRVLRVLREVLDQFRVDPAWREVVLEAEVPGVEALGESSVNVRVLVKTVPMKQWDVAREVRRRIKLRLDAEGIEIPFPQRVIHHLYENPAGEPRTGKRRR